MFLFVCWFVCLFVDLLACFVCLCVRMFVRLFVCAFACLFVCLIVCVFCVFVSLVVCLCACCFCLFACLFVAPPPTFPGGILFNAEYDNSPKAATSKHKMFAPTRDVISVFLTGPGDGYFRLHNLAVGLQEGLSRSCRGPLGRFHKFRHGLPRGLLGSLALVGHCADPRVPSIPLAQPGRRFP